MESRLEVLKEQGFPAYDKFRHFMESELLQDAARGTILWIDEAGSLSTRQMRWTVDFARGSDCQLKHRDRDILVQFYFHLAAGKPWIGRSSFAEVAAKETTARICSSERDG